MAQFVRIGKDLINLDQVQAMVETTHYQKPCVRIQFAGEDNWLPYTGEAREQLHAFMRQQPEIFVPERCSSRTAQPCMMKRSFCPVAQLPVSTRAIGACSA